MIWTRGAAAIAAVMLLAGCAGSDSGTDTAGASSTSTKHTTSKNSSSSKGDAPPAVDCDDPDLSQAEWVDNCGPDATGGGNAPTTSPSYDHPADMMDKATAKLPYLTCEEDVPQRDIYGALGLSCTGRNGEAVSFDIYKTNGELISALESKSEINPSSTYYAGENWTTSAEDDRTLADLQRVLDPKNAPKVVALTKSEAKREYQRMVEPLNDSLGELEFVDEESNVSEFQSACTTIEDAHITFIDELEFAGWPTDVKATIPALVKNLKADLPHWKTCKEAATSTEANAALDQLSGDRAPANTVRSALGLEVAK